MKLPWTLIITLLAQQSVLGLTPTKRTYLTHNYYVLEHDPQAEHGASLAEIAKVLGVEVVEQAGELLNHWLVRAQKPELTSRSNDPDPVIGTFKNLHSRATLGEQSHILLRSEDVIQARAIVSSTKFLSRQTLRQRAKRAPPPVRPTNESAIQQVATRLGIVDPMFPQQWHLVNDEHPEHMMNVTPVWEMGLTGKGVISSLVDDGLDYTSEDLAENFVRIKSATYLVKTEPLCL